MKIPKGELTKEDKEGRLILSKKRAQYERAWGTIEKKKEADEMVEGLVIDAENDDSWGFGAGVVARWHFVREEKYSIFLEGGAGFAGFSDEVPSGGTNYDFTPRAALGMTYELGDGARLVGKVGWFHISNGQTGPNNPGLDSVSVAIGLSFPLGR